MSFYLLSESEDIDALQAEARAIRSALRVVAPPVLDKDQTTFYEGLRVNPFTVVLDEAAAKAREQAIFDELWAKHGPP